MTSKMQRKHLGHTCDMCGLGHYKEPDSGQEWHLVCDECETIKFVYEPMPHQYNFHADPAKFRMYAGGFGSAKTSTCCAEIIIHILNTPGGTTLIGAATLPQLENTAQKEFFEMFPKEFIQSYHKQKNYLDTINGHRVIFRPLDDEGKSRSLNLTAFWIEEASEVKYEYFVQLQTRLRNHATDNHLGLLSTNPDMNWVKSEFLLKSENITGAEEDYQVTDPNPNFSTHIAETRKNIYLPPDYYESVARGKPDWWIRRYLHGSFENREGLVFPQYSDHIVEPFDIPLNWPRYQGVDFGLRDPTASIWIATDPRTGIAYVYKEHYQAEKPVSYHAEKINEHNNTIPLGMLQQPIGDAKGKASSEKDMRSLFDYYAEYGIFFTPSTKKLEDSIMKMFGYFDIGRLKIFNNLSNLLWELQNYKYKQRTLDDDKADEKPEDKNNHAVDALRYIIAELPDNPDDLINPSFGVEDVIYTSNQKDEHLPEALREDNYGGVNDWLGYY